MNDEVRQRLRDAAGAHRPDRERMLARIERGMADPPGSRSRGVASWARARFPWWSTRGLPGDVPWGAAPDPAPQSPEGLARGTRPRGHAAPAERRGPAAGWVRIAGATAGVAGALAAGGLVVGAVLHQDTGPRQTVAVTPAPAATPSADAPAREPRPSVSPSGKGSSPAAPPATPRHSSSAPAAPPPATAPVADGPLWSDGSVDPGSNDYWAQSDITVRTERRLSALTVELRVAQTGKVSDTGNWRSLSAEDFTVSVTERDGFLVYRWVLKDGRTVPVGEYVFAGQYDHAQGRRNAGADTYGVTGRTSGGERAAVGGDFA